MVLGENPLPPGDLRVRRFFAKGLVPTFQACIERKTDRLWPGVRVEAPQLLTFLFRVFQFRTLQNLLTNSRLHAGTASLAVVVVHRRFVR